MKSNVTIKDVARELGIHHVTVSRALRDCDSVKKETRDLIKKKANELGYRPNRLAQNFRNRRSNVLAIIIPELKNPMFASFISEFTQKAYDKGYSVMVFQSSNKLSIEKEIIESLLTYRVAGVIASVTMETTEGSHFDVLKDENIPYVFFDRVPHEVKASQVLVNNFKGAYDAVSEMINSGKRRIAYISTPSHHGVFQQRFAGYKKALEDNDLSFSEEMVISVGFFREDGYAGARMLMDLKEKPDGILVVRDEIAIGALKYLKKAGFSMPDDISIIGFDNDPSCTACDPELTTVDQAIPSLVSSTFDLLFEQIRNDTLDFRKIVIEPKLIRRESC